jgi:hypothetical protein
MVYEVDKKMRFLQRYAAFKLGQGIRSVYVVNNYVPYLEIIILGWSDTRSNIKDTN